MGESQSLGDMEDACLLSLSHVIASAAATADASHLVCTDHRQLLVGSYSCFSNSRLYAGR